ncbi:MAG: ExeM/NucH family extracellular endonuclease [Actinomycetota bacterium]|nr:ExeM/NucH family extracellular endonuclease [Actinomycetota bacterium]
MTTRRWLAPAGAVVAGGIALVALGALRAEAQSSADVFVNELHYDNDGADTGEAFEIAGPAGTDLDGWSVVLYNGNGGAAYSTVDLTGTISDQGGGFGVLSFEEAGIQNGAPDGLALVDDAGTVTQFLSYEGSFTAVGGPADGTTSTDIGIAEGPSTPIGDSLQLTGTGTISSDFAWSSGPSTFGAVNTGQTFDGTTTPTTSPSTTSTTSPEPTTTTTVPGPSDPGLFVNELHYDNDGADTGEAFEIAGPAGTDLAGWSVALYNGNGGTVYTTVSLSDVIDDAGGGYGVASFEEDGIQNGSPDGLALVDPTGAVVQFLSYEGTIEATAGPAAGTTSTDIGVSEGSSTPEGESLQLTGSGTVYADFTWAEAAPETFGEINAGQTLGGVSGGPGDPGDPGEPFEPGVCGDSYTATYVIQGSGSASDMVGTTVVTEGVVVSDFQDGDLLGGFNIVDVTGDGNPATSDGLYVYGVSADVSVGDTVRVTGEVAEYNGLTEITGGSLVGTCATGAMPAPVPITLPGEDGSQADLERYEGMLVSFDDLVVNDMYNTHEFGEITLSDGVLETSTNVAEPGPDAVAIDEANSANQILLDDASSERWPEPVPYIDVEDPVRRGAAIDELVGVIDYAYSSYRLQPTDPVVFGPVERPAAPELDGDVTVASVNVLNYFTTIDTTGEYSGPRGADSAAELAQQREKLVAELTELDADVIGLQELENNGDGALADLTGALADELDEPWAYVPLPDGVEMLGDDAIRVGIIYRTDVVTPVGEALIDDDPSYTPGRLPMAQTFEADGDEFTVVVNHFKSKGCSDASGADTDQGDGQSCYNATRVAQAEANLAFVAEIRDATGDDDVVVLGDLNSYLEEDPIAALEAELVHELRALPRADGYSYVYFGQQGFLDHILTTPELHEKVVDVAVWHINADEARVLDYNDEVVDNENDDPSQLSAEGAARSSDHDPVLIGIDLDDPVTGPTCDGLAATIIARPHQFVVFGTGGDDVIVGTDRGDIIFGRGGDDVICGGDGADIIDAGTGDDTVFGEGGADLLTGGRGRDLLDGGPGRDILLGGLGRDTCPVDPADLLRFC